MEAAKCSAGWDQIERERESVTMWPSLGDGGLGHSTERKSQPSFLWSFV